MLFAGVFCIGAIAQTVNSRSLAVFYAARVVSGLGLGAATVVVPMFSSEMVPSELRGQIGFFFQLFTLGIFTSYWIDYRVSVMKDDLTSQWQIPIGLQLLPAVVLGAGALTLKEKLLHGDSAKRVLAGFCIIAAQQATGATAFAYFGPQYFTLLVGGGQRALLLTAVFGAVKVAACGAFMLFLASRFSRYQGLVGGAAVMAACRAATASVVRARPAPEDGAVTASGVFTVALIYLFVATYNISWGPMSWPYMSKIFPARIREPGIAIGAASQWLFNFVFSFMTPYMMDRLGWGTFLVWGVFDAVISVMAFLFLKETKDLSLEAIASQRFNKRV
ncbi:hypothetical protein QQZ08_004168 [Neonectria magnoliae]|uniref:Major facilitator superfamily (MFS) profile domain-containing protein n=1 Tax=Neonectria magnoliae TaxID=2732573 RepID=A0ABR1I782_9HYPO